MVARNLWIYNEGTPAHRGVWHLVKEGTYKEEIKPTSTREYEWEVKDYAHPTEQANRENGWRTEYPTIGTYRVVEVTPEHSVIKADAACGQRNGIEAGGTAWNYFMKSNPKWIGKVIRFTKKLNEVRVQYQSFSPEPSCSRCVKKAGGPWDIEVEDNPIEVIG